MAPNEEFHILTIHFEPLKRGQPLYKGQNSWFQGVLIIEVPLYMLIGNIAVRYFISYYKLWRCSKV